MEKIKVYGSKWCGDSRRALRIFDEYQIAYDWINIDEDREGEAFVKETNRGYRSVPTIIFPDTSILVEPSKQELVDKIKSINI